MRKGLVLTLALVVALATVGVVGTASAENIQSISGKVRPKKLFKKGKRKTVSVAVNVSTVNPSNPYAVPSPTTFAKIDFGKNLMFQNKGLDTCPFRRFTAATTTDQAQNLCRPSLIGGGRSTVVIPTGLATAPIFVPATVTAFNASKRRIVLHTFNSISGGTTLVGKLRKDRTAGGRYRTTLLVPVPPLAGGTAVITQFSARVKKAYRYRGNWRALASGLCRGKRIRFQARFTYADGSSDTARDTQRCKVKKQRR